MIDHTEILMSPLDSLPDSVSIRLIRKNSNKYKRTYFRLTVFGRMPAKLLYSTTVYVLGVNSEIKVKLHLIVANVSSFRLRMEVCCFLVFFFSI